MNDVSGSQDGAALMDNTVTWLGGDSGSLFLLKEKRSHLLITTFGVLCMNHLLIVTTSSASLVASDLQADVITVYSLASRNHSWEVLFMVMIVMVMIIDSHYDKHHYYLVLINSSMKGALKNTELDPVLANGLIRKK